MVVWGGYDGKDVLDTGARYDPVADRWRSISTANAPSPRYRHTAIWTGNVMIVWGEEDDYEGTGGRYDPATDSWVPTATEVNVPSPRTGHASVWTGAEMIVWGGLAGYGNSVLLRDGGRYDPASDTWTAIAFNLVALFLLVLPVSRSLKYLNVACVLAILGIWIEKGMGLVVPGFIPSPLGEMVEYTPTVNETLVGLGIWAFGLLAYTIFLRMAIPILQGRISKSGGVLPDYEPEEEAGLMAGAQSQPHVETAHS